MLLTGQPVWGMDLWCDVGNFLGCLKLRYLSTLVQLPPR